MASTAYEALRDYVFAVIPLFMLMGDFLAKCGAATDLYTLANRLSRWLPARLAVATIISNAIFAFVTGVSIAAAAAFSRIAYPEMKRYGYQRQFALGCVAGSACLGMLIPPSVLMIVWGVLTELSHRQAVSGRRHSRPAAGRRLLRLRDRCRHPEAGSRRRRSAPFASAPRRLARRWPARSRCRATTNRSDRCCSAPACVDGADQRRARLDLARPAARRPRAPASARVGAMILAVIKGIKPHEVWQVVADVGRTSGPLLLLLFAAQLYSARAVDDRLHRGRQGSSCSAAALAPGVSLRRDGADLVRAGLPDRLDLDHPADGADLRADRSRSRLRSASLRDHRHSGDRNWPP